MRRTEIRKAKAASDLGRRTSDVGPQEELLRAKVRGLKSELGSVVGIQIEVGDMYTGTLIQELMTMVEQAERAVCGQQVSEVRELQQLYELQIPSIQGDGVFAGAA